MALLIEGNHKLKKNHNWQFAFKISNFEPTEKKIDVPFFGILTPRSRPSTESR